MLVDQDSCHARERLGLLELCEIDALLGPNELISSSHAFVSAIAFTVEIRIYMYSGARIAVFRICRNWTAVQC